MKEYNNKHWKYKTIQYIDETLESSSPQSAAGIYESVLVKAKDNRNVTRCISKTRLVGVLKEHYNIAGYGGKKKPVILWEKKEE